MLNIQNIGKSHDVIQRIKLYKKKSVDGIFVVEDLSILDDWKKEKGKAKTVVFCDELLSKELGKEVLEYYKDNSDEIYSVSSKVFLDLVEKGNAQGIVAIIEKPFLSIEDLANKNYSFVLVNDGIEIPGNLGTIVRTCDAVNVDLIINVNEKTKFNSPKVIQSSRGMILFKDIVSCSYEEAQEYLLNNKFNIFLGEPELGKSYDEYNYDGNVAIVVGSERFGIDQRWYEKEHKKVFIPMLGRMGSLNVGVAASVLLYEAMMKRK